MPSLHVAFPVVCLLVALRARLPRLVVAAFALNVLAVVFAIVYMGEHYVFDALAGALCGLVAWQRSTGCSTAAPPAADKRNVRIPGAAVTAALRPDRRPSVAALSAGTARSPA